MKSRPSTLNISVANGDKCASSPQLESNSTTARRLKRKKRGKRITACADEDNADTGMPQRVEALMGTGMLCLADLVCMVCLLIHGVLIDLYTYVYTICR
jgi:hypothetical protein